MAMTYAASGVDQQRGDDLVDRITKLANKTKSAAVLAGIGGFGAVYDLKALKKFNDPLLVTGCDGVGTKLKLAFAAGKHDTVGIDLVAMSVNDILCHGAEPLFFLDYYATSKLDLLTAERVLAGIVEGCERAGCSLVGGETAELPGFYSNDEYDLAGFAVGAVEREQLLPRADVRVGDVAIGLQSSGLHSNGYSLARRIVFDGLQMGLNDELPMGAGRVGEVLLEPTRIYVKNVLALRKHVNVKAIAHITGGGLIENVPRVMPANTTLEINPIAWRMPKIFTVLQAAGEVPPGDMFRTFNMGIGMVLFVSADEAATALKHLRDSGEQAYELGVVAAGLGEATCTISGVP